MKSFQHEAGRSSGRGGAAGAAVSHEAAATAAAAAAARRSRAAAARRWQQLLRAGKAVGGSAAVLAAVAGAGVWGLLHFKRRHPLELTPSDPAAGDAPSSSSSDRRTKKKNSREEAALPVPLAARVLVFPTPLSQLQFVGKTLQQKQLPLQQQQLRPDDEDTGKEGGQKGKQQQQQDGRKEKQGSLGGSARRANVFASPLSLLEIAAAYPQYHTYAELLRAASQLLPVEFHLQQRDAFCCALRENIAVLKEEAADICRAAAAGGAAGAERATGAGREAEQLAARTAAASAAEAMAGEAAAEKGAEAAVAGRRRNETPEEQVGEAAAAAEEKEALRAAAVPAHAATAAALVEGRPRAAAEAIAAAVERTVEYTLQQHFSGRREVDFLRAVDYKESLSQFAVDLEQIFRANSSTAGTAATSQRSDSDSSSSINSSSSSANSGSGLTDTRGSDSSKGSPRSQRKCCSRSSSKSLGSMRCPHKSCCSGLGGGDGPTTDSSACREVDSSSNSGQKTRSSRAALLSRGAAAAAAGQGAAGGAADPATGEEVARGGGAERESDDSCSSCCRKRNSSSSGTACWRGTEAAVETAIELLVQRVEQQITEILLLEWQQQRFFDPLTYKKDNFGRRLAREAAGRNIGTPGALASYADLLKQVQGHAPLLWTDRCSRVARLDAAPLFASQQQQQEQLLQREQQQPYEQQQQEQQQGAEAGGWRLLLRRLLRAASPPLAPPAAAAAAPEPAAEGLSLKRDATSQQETKEELLFLGSAEIARAVEALDDVGFCVIKAALTQQQLSTLRRAVAADKAMAASAAEEMLRTDPNVWCNRPTRGRLHCLLRGTLLEDFLTDTQRVWLPVVHAYLPPVARASSADRPPPSLSSSSSSCAAASAFPSPSSAANRRLLALWQNQAEQQQQPAALRRHGSSNGSRRRETTGGEREGVSETASSSGRRGEKTAVDDGEAHAGQGLLAVRDLRKRVFVSDIQTVTADPLAVTQPWHRDNSSRGLTIVVPLCDVDGSNGSTELLPFSHLLTSKEEGLLQKCRTCCCSLVRLLSRSGNTVRPTLQAGDVLIYDARLLHRGRNNETWHARPVLIFRYDYEDCPPPGDYVRRWKVRRTYAFAKAVEALLDVYKQL